MAEKITTAGIFSQIERLNTLDAIADVEKFLRGLFRQLGVDDWIYCMYLGAEWNQPKAFASATYTPVWLLEYRLADYRLVDPLILYAVSETEPKIWNAEATDGWEISSPVIVDFMAARRKHGWLCGLLVPLPTGDPFRGFLHLVFKDSLENAREKINQILPVAQYIGMSINRRVKHLAVPADILPGKGDLSAREIECARWAADGKNAAETSIIMGVAERTVRAHLNSLVKKMNAQSVTQAVVKAVRSELVVPTLATVDETLLLWEEAMQRMAKIDGEKKETSS